MESFSHRSMDPLSVVVSVTHILVVVEMGSHVNWIFLKDKTSLNAGIRKEVQGKLRWFDAAVSDFGLIW
jgi:hypothetical protein